LYLLTLDNPLRRLAIKGIECKWWDRGVLAFIFLNTIQLALYDPFDILALKPVSVQRDIMDSIGIAFSAVFLAECLVKITAMGFVVGPRAYLKDSWNYLDVVVVVIGVIDFFPSDGSSSNLSALRSLRVMRPLRLVNKFPELRDTVSFVHPRSQRSLADSRNTHTYTLIHTHTHIHTHAHTRTHTHTHAHTHTHTHTHR